MIMASYQCDCGQPAKFFKMETGTHQCEQCTLNQIYSDEQNDDVYSKVLMKMRNIMAIRQKALKKKLKQTQRQGRHSKDINELEDTEIKKSEEQIKQSEEQRIREAAATRQKDDQVESKLQAASLARNIRQEQVMTQQVNLMYDLLHIEIEKMRRRSMQQIKARFNQMQQQQLLESPDKL